MILNTKYVDQESTSTNDNRESDQKRVLKVKIVEESTFLDTELPEDIDRAIDHCNSNQLFHF